CDRLHHYFWNQYVDPAAPHHARFLDFYRRLDDVLGALAEPLPAGTPLFIVAHHGHSLIHREFYPNAWLPAQGLLRFTSEPPTGPPAWWQTSPTATIPRAHSRSARCSGGARSPACTPTPTRSFS